MSSMPKILNPIIASIIGFRLSNFIIMMREFQITSS